MFWLPESYNKQTRVCGKWWSTVISLNLFNVCVMEDQSAVIFILFYFFPPVGQSLYEVFWIILRKENGKWFIVYTRCLQL